MDIVAPRPRSGPGRCALCHDVAVGDASTCGACGTWTHSACALEVGGACPTLGCARSVALVRPPRSARRRRGPPTAVVFLAAALGFFWSAELVATHLGPSDGWLRVACVGAGAVCVLLAAYSALGPVRLALGPVRWRAVRYVLLRFVLPVIAVALLGAPCTITGQVL